MQASALLHQPAAASDQSSRLDILCSTDCPIKMAISNKKVISTRLIPTMNVGRKSSFVTTGLRF